MPIGTHGMSHRSWRDMSPSESRVELVEARDALTEVTGQPVVEAAMPLGMYDRRVLADLRRHGYERVFTSDQAASRADAWLQPRFSVTRSDTAASVRHGMLSRPPLVQRTERRVAQLVKGLR